MTLPYGTPDSTSINLDYVFLNLTHCFLLRLSSDDKLKQSRLSLWTSKLRLSGFNTGMPEWQRIT